MSNPLAISSALWIGTGTLGMIWGLSQPYPSPNKFYGFWMGAIASSIGTALSYPAMKRSERKIIRQDTCDQIFDIGEAATVERYKQAVFPSPKMPDLNIYNHVLGIMPGEETEDKPPIVAFNSILDRGVGICLFGDSGSGKSSAAKYLIGLASQGSEIKLIVCDPHYDGGGDWGKDTLIIDDYDLILRCLRASLDELDHRKAQRKQGVKQFPKLVFIWDEWPSVRVAAKNKKSNICEEAVIRLGSECRKYDMLSIFCSQSGNTKAMGLEGMGDFLQNFSLIRLGKISIKHAKNLPDQRVLNCLQNAGYPCLVDDDLSTHPTHGNYQQFRNGQPPQNLLPVRTAPITLAEILEEKIATRPKSETPRTSTPSPGFDIKKLDKKPENDSNPDDKFMQILAFCKNKESVSARDVQRVSVGSNLSSDAIKYAFEWLENNGFGTVKSEQIGGSIRVSFTPF
ncbi:MAG: type IV secretory system conjugative DNA transfer family protein [Planktothrix sp.]